MYLLCDKHNNNKAKYKYKVGEIYKYTHKYKFLGKFRDMIMLTASDDNVGKNSSIGNGKGKMNDMDTDEGNANDKNMYIWKDHENRFDKNIV